MTLLLALVAPSPHRPLLPVEAGSILLSLDPFSSWRSRRRCQLNLLLLRLPIRSMCLGSVLFLFSLLPAQHLFSLVYEGSKAAALVEHLRCAAGSLPKEAFAKGAAKGSCAAWPWLAAGRAREHLKKAKRAARGRAKLVAKGKGKAGGCKRRHKHRAGAACLGLQAPAVPCSG